MFTNKNHQESLFHIRTDAYSYMSTKLKLHKLAVGLLMEPFIVGPGQNCAGTLFQGGDTFARRHFNTSLTVRVRLGLRFRVGVRVKCYG